MNLELDFSNPFMKRYFSLPSTKETLKWWHKYLIEVSFRGQRVGQFYADLLVENSIIVEIKAGSSLSPKHKAQ